MSALKQAEAGLLAEETRLLALQSDTSLSKKDALVNLENTKNSANLALVNLEKSIADTLRDVEAMYIA